MDRAGGLVTDLDTNLDEVLTDPVGVIVRLVEAVEPDLDATMIRAIVATVVRTRTSRRRLASALLDDPSVLRTGRLPAPSSAARLLVALRDAGAGHMPLPCCGMCGRASRRLHGPGWSCARCGNPRQVCAGCRQDRPITSRDRHGKPRCRHCGDQADDTVADLVRVVTELDRMLEGDVVRAALVAAARHPAQQQRLAWVVLAQPELLTGAGYLAPAPAVLRFIDHLADAGATAVIKPACPGCHQVKPLLKVRDSQRICRRCFARTTERPCSGCGRTREPAARDAQGAAVCHTCWTRDRSTWEDCVGCGRRRPVALRRPDGPRCDACRPMATATCTLCGRTAACTISKATGQPWCLRCHQRWATCAGCGSIAPVRGGSRDAPLCARCTNPDPGFWGRCPACGTTWQLSPQPCQRCVLDQHVRRLLGDQNGVVRPDLAALHQALTGVTRPDNTLTWLARSTARELLTHLARDTRPLTHESLDELPTGKVLAHLRSILVAAGTLPDRDERLVALERWITAAVHARTDPGELRILHGYAVWYHLRKLRQRLGDTHTSRAQDLNVRCHVTAATNFLDWLDHHTLTLGTCTQTDLDRWITEPASRHRDETSHFIRWAVGHRHAKALTFRTAYWTAPRGTLDTEKRWANARRLLQEDTLPTADRVAGLLLLLYAQRIATITHLTVDHIHLDHDRVEITLGTSPIVLPEPLAALVRDLVATRRGHAMTGNPSDTPWLFPGGRPGQPLSDQRLAARLHALGLDPEQDRSTALFALATELPAALLARMLGISVKVATTWQRASAGDWTAYAADLSQRERQLDKVE